MIVKAILNSCFRVFFASLTTASGFAQSVTSPVIVPERSAIDSSAVDFPSEIYSIRPNTVSGPKFDLELPDGLSCSSQNGTPPALNFYGGSTQRDNRYQAFPDFVTEGYSLGAVLSVPLKTSRAPRCDEAYRLYLISKKLELLESLYDTGVLSDAQVQSLSLKSLKELGLDVDDAIKMLDSGNLPNSQVDDDFSGPKPFVVGPK